MTTYRTIDDGTEAAGQSVVVIPRYPGYSDESSSRLWLQSRPVYHTGAWLPGAIEFTGINFHHFDLDI